MRVLVACEYSGKVRSAFRALGHDAWSCDLLPAEDGDPHHYECDVRMALQEPWDMMIAHPPCTYLTRSGWNWVNAPDCDVLPLKGEPRRRAAVEAAAFFMFLLNTPIPKVAIENPRPICHVGLPPFTQRIQPWWFGHGETKETCLWLKGLLPLEPTSIVDGREARIHRLSPGPNRWKERSRTFDGVAEAMADQWGNPEFRPRQPMFVF